MLLQKLRSILLTPSAAERRPLCSRIPALGHNKAAILGIGIAMGIEIGIGIGIGIGGLGFERMAHTKIVT